MEHTTDEFNEIYVWGNDEHGQLGIYHKSKSYNLPKCCSFGIQIRSISCGANHTAIVTKDGYVYTMGANSKGNLGIGDKSTESSPIPCLVESLIGQKACKVACGYFHTVIATDIGEVYSWGDCENGATAHNSKEPLYSPMQISHFKDEQLFIKHISCGSRHTAFLSFEGVLFTCGLGEQGQLGNSKNNKQFIPSKVNIASKVGDVACGISYTCLVTYDNELYAFGDNIYGQLGTGNKESCSIPTLITINTKSKIAKIACGYHSAALTSNGELFIWGTGLFGEYLYPHKLQLDSNIIDISIGGNFATFIDDRGCVYSWGSNSSGQLGHGNYQSIDHPTLVKKLESKFINLISCGSDYAIAVGPVRSNLHNNYISGDTEDGQMSFVANRPNDIYPKDVVNALNEKYESSYKSSIMTYSPNGMQKELNNTAEFREPFSTDRALYIHKSIEEQTLEPSNKEVEEKPIMVCESIDTGELKDENLSTLLTEQRNCLEKIVDEEKGINAKLKAELGTCVASINSQKATIEKLNEQINESMAIEKQLKEELAKELESTAQKQQLILEKQEIIIKLEEAHQFCAQVQNSLTESNKELKKEIESKSNSLLLITNQYEIKTQECINKEKLISQHVEDFNKLNQESKVSIESLHNELSNSENNIKLLQNNYTKASDEIKKLKESELSLQNTNAQLIKDNQQITSILEKEKSQLAQCSIKCEELLKEYNNMASSNKINETKLYLALDNEAKNSNQLKEQLQKAYSEFAAMKNEILSLKKAAEDGNAKYDNAQNSLNTERKSKEDYISKNEGNLKLIKQMEEEAAHNNEIIKQLKENNLNLENANSKLNADVLNQNAKYQQSIREICLQKDYISTQLINAQQSMAEELEDKQRCIMEYKELKGELNIASIKLEQLRKANDDYEYRNRRLARTIRTSLYDNNRPTNMSMFTHTGMLKASEQDILAKTSPYASENINQMENDDFIVYESAKKHDVGSSKKELQIKTSSALTPCNYMSNTISNLTGKYSALMSEDKKRASIGEVKEKLSKLKKSKEEIESKIGNYEKYIGKAHKK